MLSAVAGPRSQEADFDGVKRNYAAVASSLFVDFLEQHLVAKETLIGPVV